MPLFYLHLDLPEPMGYVEDLEGAEVADLEAARALAIAGARSILAEELSRGVLDLRGGIEVASEHGQVVFVLPFREAIEILTEEKS